MLREVILIFLIFCSLQQNYNIGTGIADITGPPAGVGMVILTLIKDGM